MRHSRSALLVLLLISVSPSAAAQSDSVAARPAPDSLPVPSRARPACPPDATYEACQALAANHEAYLRDRHFQWAALLASGRDTADVLRIMEMDPGGTMSFSFESNPDRARRTFWFYRSIECQAGWDESCEDELTIQVPPEWQACRAQYQVTKRRGPNHTGYDFTPTAWYTGDPQDPDRFRGYRIEIDAEGSGNPFDRWSARIRLDDVGILAIPASATNEDRFASGCEMPAHGGPAASPAPEPTTGRVRFECTGTTCVPNRHRIRVAGARPTIRFHAYRDNLRLTSITVKSTDGANDYSFAWPAGRDLASIEVTPGEYELLPNYVTSSANPGRPELQLTVTYSTTR